MKNLFFIFLFYSTIVGYSQNIKVTYNVSPNNAYMEQRKEDYENKTGTPLSSEFYKKMKETQAYFKQLNYTLITDGPISLFYMNEAMQADPPNTQLPIARILAGFSSGFYFSDRENQIKLRQTDTYGQQYLVISPYDELEWIITPKTKQIQGFKTYKAYAFESLKNSSGVHKIKIIAWFAPKLSKSFGPGGYGNLPGLIIELRRAGNIYQAEKIEKSKKQITLPTEGKKISKKEFLKIGKKINDRQ